MSVRKALAWSVIGQLSSFVIFFGGSVVIARLLSPQEMGVFAIAMATIAVLNTIANFGVTSYVVRAPELHEHTLASTFTVNAVLACWIASVITVTSLIERYYLHTPSVAEVLVPLIFCPLLGVFEFLPVAMLQREMNFQLVSSISTGKIVVSTLVAVVLAFNGFSYMSLAYGSLTSAVFGAVAANLVGGRHASFRLSLSECRKITVFGLRMVSVSGLATLASRFCDIILGQILGLAALGLYSRASSAANLIFENIYGAITRVLFVQLSTELRERGTVRDVFLRGFEMTIALMWPLLIGLAVLSRPAIYILYGEQWIPAALPLALLMIAQFITLCFGMNWELLVIYDETARLTKYEAIRAVAGVAVFSIGCLFSIAAAAVGRIVEASFGFILYRPHMDRLVQARPGEISGIYVRSLALTAVAVLPSFLLMLATHWSYRTSPLDIAASVIAGVALWLGLIVLLNHPLLAEIRMVAARVPGGKLLLRRWRPQN